MASRSSTLQVTAWLVAFIALVAMAFAAATHDRLAFGLFSLFALVGTFSRLAGPTPTVWPAWLRVLMFALYLPSLGLLAAAEVSVLPAWLLDVARWTFTTALGACLVARIRSQFGAALAHGI